MKTRIFITITLVFGIGLPAQADDVNTVDFDQKHKMCLERIAAYNGEDADTAYEEAMIWQSEGGGRRAKHCIAMALFALGHADEAAYRLEILAKTANSGNDAIRVSYYAESANLWLEAGNTHKAYEVATAGLAIDKGNVDLRIARARVYAALERWGDAEIDLSSVLVFSPDDPRALRYRADARRRQGKLTQAKADIDRALVYDGKNIDALLVRGQIIEAIRLLKATAKAD